MDDTLQELEFLDLSDLPENEVQNLRSFIVGPQNQDGGVEGSNPQPHEQQQSCEQVEGMNLVYGGHGSGPPISFPPNLDVEEPIPVGFSAPPLYQQNVCITSIPQYQPIMSYPMQIMPGGHLVASSPNYYVSNLHSPGVPHPAPFSPPHRILSPQSYYPKRKNVRAKYQTRKDMSNGHVGEGYSGMMYQPPGPYLGPCFSGDVVQAVTGVPIVMHQSVPSYVPPHNVQVTAATTTQMYPMVTFAQPAPIATLPDVIAPGIRDENHEELLHTSPTPAGDQSQTSTVSPGTVEQLPMESLAPVEVLAPPPVIPAPVISEEKPHIVESNEGKSWASLFKKDVPTVVATEKPTARVEPFTPLGGVADDKASEAASRPLVDVRTRRLAEHITTCELSMAPLALLPRGLINKSNWCYINATLQALIACPPFVHLIKSLTPFIGGKHEESTTPIMDSVIEFIDQFDVVPVRTGKERASAKKEEPHFGTSFEPSSIYKMLSKIRSETFKVEGRQEDAEEFLSCLLNGLHDEMIDIVKSTTSDSKSKVQVAEAKPGVSDDEDWQVIGPKNRGCVTHSTTYSKTPVSNLFLGLMRSALHYAGAQSTATLQPFFSLQLDIQNEKVNSVRDALACLVSKEPLTGYVCSKTGQEVEASRQTTLEELPPILILHLKCFVYDKSGGCQKLLKRVDFTSDLELSKDFLSPGQKGKLKDRQQRQYKLFAVVYHDGKEATKGHYVTEVHHSGTGSWLRFDDSIVRVVDTQLFKYNLPRMPYLLLYRKLNV